MVPTSPTTGATRRSSGLAPVSSSAEPPPPPRALSGAPLLLEIPQSSSPPHRAALAAIPDPPRPWPMPESDRPPPPCSVRRSLPSLRVGRANAGTGRGQCCGSRPRRRSARGLRRHCAAGPQADFEPLATDLLCYFLYIFKSMQIQKFIQDSFELGKL
jgi:hypothetical protein